MTKDKAIYQYFCTIVASICFISAAVVFIFDISNGITAKGMIVAAKITAVASLFTIPPLLYRRFGDKSKDNDKSKESGLSTLLASCFYLLIGIGMMFFAHKFYITGSIICLIAMAPVMVAFFHAFTNLPSIPFNPFFPIYGLFGPYY